MKLKSFENNTRGNGKDMNIILCGFMGSGKTVVGTELAKITGRKFVDTDEMVEKSKVLRLKQFSPQEVKNIFATLNGKCARKLHK